MDAGKETRWGWRIFKGVRRDNRSNVILTHRFGPRFGRSLLGSSSLVRVVAVPQQRGDTARGEAVVGSRRK